MCTKVAACEVPWGSEAQKPIHLIFPPIDLCKLSSGEKMPKVKRSRKAPPDGWELIEPTLDELDQKMREAETEPHEGKRKVESLWPIFRIHHQKTRYIFDLFYKRKAISRELYEYCIKEGYADKNLIAKWKKQGYENLCCLRCIQTRDTNFGTNCICRVPKSKLEVVMSPPPSRVTSELRVLSVQDSALLDPGGLYFAGPD
uniref:Protein BUD31 homolog n=1 Tax=Sus scrofa TaxID=9823 RepID=A0A8D1FBI0_PIG